MMFSIDLKDAYFQVPIHPHSRPYLWIMLNWKVYQFWALCIGLSSAPQVFTRVFTLASAWAHDRGIHLFHYLDDCLIVVESIPLLLWHRNLLLQLCQDLGIVII